MVNIFEKKNKDGTVFCQINRNTKKGFYLILPESSQNRFCERINLLGFDTLPSGFYTNDGLGLTGGGVFIFLEITNIYRKKVDLTITKTGVKKLDARGRKVKLSIPHQQLTSLNATVRTTKRIRNDEIRSAVRRFLSEEFRRQFKQFKGTKPVYTPGLLNEVLKKNDVTTRLNAEDRQALAGY